MGNTKDSKVIKQLKQRLPTIYNNWIQTRITQSLDDIDRSFPAVDTLSRTFVLSVSDGYRKAKTISFVFDVSETVADSAIINNYTDFKKILPILIEKINNLSTKFTKPLAWLRLEWVTQVSPTTWIEFQDNLRKFKRNYYRSGIAFIGVREPWLLLTEMELNANACLYAGNTVTHAKVNMNNLNVYLRARHGSSQIPSFSDNLPLISFNTAGVFFDIETSEHYDLETKPRNKGHRILPLLSAETTKPIIEMSTNYLAKQVQPSGQYVYGHFPCFGRTIDTYNSLRHASSTYALIEGYEACRDFENTPPEDSNKDESISSATPSKLSLSQMKSDIDKAMGYLIHQLIQIYDDKAYVVDTGGEIKLGANAVAILALAKYLQVFSDAPKADDYYALAEKLALGILAMQQEDGSFVHVLHSEGLTVKAKHRIIYYDGEAAFALMRLYGLTKDERWIDCVTRAFDYFIAAKHYKAHDHWLSYCSNELIIYKPEKKYFQFAVDNVTGYVNFIKTRITTFPTLLELSMAFHNMLSKLDEHPEFHDVLDGFDVQAFYQALHARANHLLNGFFFPEMAMFYKLPQSILHGFFIRHHSFRVRIDDVEHYLSGLIAYQNFLRTKSYPELASKKQQAINQNTLSKEKTTQEAQDLSQFSALNADALAKVTKGNWLIVPSKDWSATGLCIWAPSFKFGQMIVARSKTMKTGYLSKKAIKSLVSNGASAIITDDALAYKDMAVPVLHVQNVSQAVINIGRYARQSYSGQVLGVTGSAGKTTTVHMLAHTLNEFGGADYNQSSANLPIGISWNLASMEQSAKYWVLEMAIGSMSANTNLVRPDIALITNIAPAHLEYHHNVENVALKKSRIFEGMTPGSTAIVCRDIEQYKLIEGLASIWGIQIISYGEHKESTIKLIKYDQKTAQAQIIIENIEYKINLQARGQHMVLNAMAVLAIVSYYQLSIADAISKLESFKAVAGRGEIRDIIYQGTPITLYDEAYNANPLSMKAALATFDQLDVNVQDKVLILGDMLELGSDSEKYHLDLIPIIKNMDFRMLVLVGTQTKVLADTLKNLGVQLQHFQNIEALQSQLSNIIKPKNHVFIKSSNGIGLNKLF